ncbi:STAS domain-containing protein [Streptomyces sp. NPDC060011]|uniref:STAS domain-containing protein n=1 Tax=Streptomyces sp. NPDC060011 TaxID=3347037 RepID=UPI0036B2EA18
MTSPGTAAAEIPVLAPNGELDFANMTPFAEALEAASRQHPAVIVDLSNVTFGDSTFLNTLLHCHQLTDLRLAAVPTLLTRVFDITGMHRAMNLYPTVEAAQTPKSPSQAAGTV